MATIDEIKQQAAAVKNATQVGENTAERVGDALAGLADIAKQQDTELGKKFDKESIAQEAGDSEELVMSQKAVSDKLSDLDTDTTKAISDTEKLKKYLTVFTAFSQEYTKGKVCATGNIGESVNITDAVSRGTGLFKIQCVKGDAFKIYSRVTSQYGIVVINDSGKILQKAGINSNSEQYSSNIVITADNASYILINHLGNETYNDKYAFVIKNSISDSINTIKKDIKLIKESQKVEYKFNDCIADKYIDCKNLGKDFKSLITQDASSSYLILNCNSNENFLVTTYGGNNARAFCFADAEGNLIEPRAAASATIVDYELNSPLTAKYLIVNLRHEGNLSKKENFKVISYNKLAEKLDKDSVVQEFGDAEDKVISQKVVSDKLSDEFAFLHISALLKYSSVSIKKDFSNYNISNNFITQAGVITKNTKTDLTDYIECNENDLFYYNGIGAGCVVAGYSDNLGNGFFPILSTGKDSIVLSFNQVISIPKGVKYVRAWARNKTHPETPSSLVFKSLTIFKGEADDYIKNIVVSEIKSKYNHQEVSEKIITSVNSIKPAINFAQNSSDFYEEGKKYNHTSFFKAPKKDGVCKLVISFPGGGASSESWYSYMNHGTILNKLGYAVLTIQGWSADWCHDKINPSTNSVMPVGNWMALEEAVKAYQYIINKYDWIEKNGVYLYGESQGGCLAENFAELANIPVLATVLDSPVISLKYHMWNFRQDAIHAFYGIESSNWDEDKVIGCDPYTRNIIGEISGSGTNPSSVVDFNNVTAKKIRNCRSPLIILLSDDDTVLSPSVTKGYIRALKNGGSLCEVKNYNLANTPGHGIVQYTSVIGSIDNVNVTAGLAQILEFYRRYGGYDYSISNSKSLTLEI